MHHLVNFLNDNQNTATVEKLKIIAYAPHTSAS